MKKIKGWIGTLLFFIVICCIVLYGFNKSSYTNTNEDLKRVNKAVHTALIQCYSIEGSYPTDFEYLKKNYALHVNDDKYRINYDYVGSNMMPNIVVYRKGDYHE